MNNEDVVPRDTTSLYSLDYNGLLEITRNTHMLLQMQRPVLLGCLCYAGTQSPGRNASLKFYLPKGPSFRSLTPRKKPQSCHHTQRLGEIWPRILSVLQAQLSHVPIMTCSSTASSSIAAYTSVFPGPCEKGFYGPTIWSSFSFTLCMTPSGLHVKRHAFPFFCCFGRSSYQTFRGQRILQPTTALLLRSGTFLSQYTFGAF